MVCLTRGAEVITGSSAPLPHPPAVTTLCIYTQPLPPFRVTHSCGNVSIVAGPALYGQQLGAGILAEAWV